MSNKLYSKNGYNFKNDFNSYNISHGIFAYNKPLAFLAYSLILRKICILRKIKKYYFLAYIMAIVCKISFL